MTWTWWLWQLGTIVIGTGIAVGIGTYPLFRRYNRIQVQIEQLILSDANHWNYHRRIDEGEGDGTRDLRETMFDAVKKHLATGTAHSDLGSNGIGEDGTSKTP